MRTKSERTGRVVLLAVLAGAMSTAPAQAQEAISVMAAGSLRAPLTQAARAFEQAHPGTTVTLTFGASGLLHDRIAAGEQADVFASANMKHPQSLAGKGYGPTTAFARNALCALARPGLALTSETLVPVLLDPAVKVGTSTPKADPSGDYAFELFQRVEQRGAAPAGSGAALAAKALPLTGGPTSPAPPKGRSVYGMLVASG